MTIGPRNFGRRRLRPAGAREPTRCASSSLLSQAKPAPALRDARRPERRRAEQGRAGQSSQAPRSMETHARTPRSQWRRRPPCVSRFDRSVIFARPAARLPTCQRACLPACQPASVPAGVPAWPRRGASSGAAAQSSRGRQSEASSFLLDPGAGPGYLWEAYLLITRDLGR